MLFVIPKHLGKQYSISFKVTNWKNFFLTYFVYMQGVLLLCP